MTLTDLYTQEKKKAGDGPFPSFSTFTGWNVAGRKFCRLAAGGTLYFLIIIAATNKVWETLKLTENAVDCVANFLRHPSGGEFFTYVFLFKT